jgi:hypothetical protein
MQSGEEDSMSTNIRAVLNRVRFYILLLGGFLGLEIPLFIFTFFKYFPTHRHLIWVFTLLLGVASSLIVFFLIHAMINDNYEIKLLFDSNNYDSLFKTERKETRDETV